MLKKKNATCKKRSSRLDLIFRKIPIRNVITIHARCAHRQILFQRHAATTTIAFSGLLRSWERDFISRHERSCKNPLHEHVSSYTKVYTHTYSPSMSTNFAPGDRNWNNRQSNRFLSLSLDNWYWMESSKLSLLN